MMPEGITSPQRSSTWPWAVLLLAALSVAAGSSRTAAAAEEPLASPGLTVQARLHAEGAQIYECRAGVDGLLGWQFREPVATLLDGGRTVGQHTAGPSWALADGGPTLVGRVTARLPGSGAQDIPWLRLEVADRRGNTDAGRLAAVSEILRINTVGGTAGGACATPGAFQSIAYAADYVFLAPGSGTAQGTR